MLTLKQKVMKWINESERKPPPNKSVFLKCHYKNHASSIMGVGFYSKYEAPHWQTGIKIYGSYTEDPISIEWLDETPSSPSSTAEEIPMNNILDWIKKQPEYTTQDFRTEGSLFYHVAPYHYAKLIHRYASQLRPIPAQQGYSEERCEYEQLVEKYFGIEMTKEIEAITTTDHSLTDFACSVHQHFAVEGVREVCICHNCNKEYSYDLIIPDELWNKIAPKKVEGFKGGGLLCPECIVSKLQSLPSPSMEEIFKWVSANYLFVMGKWVPKEHIYVHGSEYHFKKVSQEHGIIFDELLKKYNEK